MTELDAAKLVSLGQFFVCAYTCWYIGAPMSMANGKRPFLRLLAGVALLSFVLSYFVWSQTQFRTAEIIHDWVTWPFQWSLRLVPGLLSIGFIQLGRAIYRR